MTATTASALRNNIYKLLDQVAEGGAPLLINRKGRVLKIALEEKPDRLAQLPRHDCIKGDADDLVHQDWSSEWSDDLS